MHDGPTGVLYGWHSDSVLPGRTGAALMNDRQEGRERGREATSAAILAAAQELFSAQGFTPVTVRAIAERAGVSHALVHRYLGSKADIYRAVLTRNEDAILNAASDDPDLLESASLMLREALTTQREYVRLVAHSALRGVSYDRTSGGSRRPSVSSSSHRRRPPRRLRRSEAKRTSTHVSWSPAQLRSFSDGSRPSPGCFPLQASATWTRPRPRLGSSV